MSARRVSRGLYGRRSSQILGYLFEVRRVVVESTGHLSHANTDGPVGFVEVDIDNRLAACCCAVPADSAQVDASVDGQDGVLLWSLIAQVLSGLGIVWSEKKRLARRRFSSAKLSGRLVVSSP